ncbi:hypothetical protein SAMN04488238_12716 [Roseicitreum antarcticum]|uniref:Uncharacterized protein n=1 Tax=Roseicitreum antarcticum TaxID=564137 RepID=A0A1H3EY86_9RHOB|nr:hypothetical protein SAMN04488238_12716 [Roseicitreum antarcticum]
MGRAVSAGWDKWCGSLRGVHGDGGWRKHWHSDCGGVMVHPVHAQEPGGRIGSDGPRLADLLEMHARDGRGGGGPGGAAQREGHALASRRTAHPGGNAGVTQRVDAARHFVETCNGAWGAAHKTSSDGRDPVKHRDMGIIPHTGCRDAVQRGIGKDDVARLALACGIGRGRCGLQHSLEVELDGDPGIERDAYIDPLGLTVGRAVAGTALHAGITMGNGVIAVGCRDRFDLGDHRIACVIELQKVRFTAVDAVGIPIGRDVAKPQPQVAGGLWYRQGEWRGIGVEPRIADRVDVERGIKPVGSGADQPGDARDVDGLVTQVKNVTHGISISI